MYDYRLSKICLVWASRPGVCVLKKIEDKNIEIENRNILLLLS